MHKGTLFIIKENEIFRKMRSIRKVALILNIILNEVPKL